MVNYGSSRKAERAIARARLKPELILASVDFTRAASRVSFFFFSSLVHMKTSYSDICRVRETEREREIACNTSHSDVIFSQTRDVQYNRYAY